MVTHGGFVIDSNSSMTQLRASLVVRDKIVSLQAALAAIPKPLDMRDCRPPFPFHSFITLHLFITYPCAWYES